MSLDSPSVNTSGFPEKLVRKWQPAAILSSAVWAGHPPTVIVDSYKIELTCNVIITSDQMSVWVGFC